MRKKYQRTPKEKRDEIVLAYLRGENTYQKLGKYYGVPPETIMVCVSRYRKRKNVVSLQTDSKPSEDMARKKKEAEKPADVLALEAHIRELELQNLALNTLIDVAEKNGIEIIEGKKVMVK